MEKVSVKASGKAYDILIEAGLFSRLPEIFSERYAGKKLAVVSDSNVFHLYGEDFVKELGQKGFEVTPIVFEAGEEQKNLHTLTRIYTGLAEGMFTRSDMVIALGGGVVGDMAGLAAATFLRGLGFIQIPTSLLAMVDSSVGGKVAVDLPQGKNLVGAFYHPDAVFTDPKLLETLSDRQLANGMGELLKTGMIQDAALFDDLVCLAEMNETADQKIEGTMKPALRRVLSQKLDQFIKRSCQIKSNIVEADEYDHDLRQLLNFGHTLGHAIERVQNYKGLSHGEAISIGMVVFTRLTEGMGLTPEGEVQKVIHALELYGLPTKVPALCKEELLEAIRLDKKTRSGKITIAYIEQVGRGKLLTLDLKDLEERIDGILTHSLRTT